MSKVRHYLFRFSWALKYPCLAPSPPLPSPMCVDPALPTWGTDWARSWVSVPSWPAMNAWSLVGYQGQDEASRTPKEEDSPRTGRRGNFTPQRSLYPFQFPNRSSHLSSHLWPPAHCRVPDWISTSRSCFLLSVQRVWKRGLLGRDLHCPRHQQEAKSSACVRHL